MKNKHITIGDITLILIESKGIPMFSIIDTQDAHLLNGRCSVSAQWGSDGNRCYARVGVPTGRRGGAHETLHRVISSPAGGLDVDHINHFTMDNRRGNLRCVTHSVNLFNRNGADQSSGSGVRGVWWDSRRERWRAFYAFGGKGNHLGYFTHKAEAEAAVKAARSRIDPIAA